MTNLPAINPPPGQYADQKNYWLPYLITFLSGLTIGYILHVLRVRSDKKQRLEDAKIADKRRLEDTQRAREAELKKARIAFKSAFVELRAKCGALMTYDIAGGFMGPHERAITEFRHHVSQADLTGFDAACENYRKCRYPERTPSQQLGPFFTQAQTDELAKSIDALLAFADRT